MTDSTLSLRPTRQVLVLGATGYLGAALTRNLLARGHSVRALVRHGSEHKLPAGVRAFIGSALEASDISAAMQRGDTVVHLVGTPSPAPWKGNAFERVDLSSALACVEAYKQVGAAHLVYVSVAHPAPVMARYIAVRQRAERAIVDGNLSATILRPWYVLGPGHRWPVALLPLYALAERVPTWRDSALRLGLVTHSQMVRALVHSVESTPPSRVPVILEVPGIRSASDRSSTTG